MVQEQVALNDVVVGVAGLGYVGLPLALAFGRTEIKTIGFDIKQQRINELKNGIDSTKELTPEEIRSSKLIFTSSEADLRQANFIIVAVPTPVTSDNLPDLTIMEKASELVGRNLTPGAIIVYESTVYPGVTEEVCVPILEKVSGLKCGTDFKVGYSPERINPGDKEHTLERIVKVVAGMDEESTAKIAAVYRAVCEAGVFVAANIKTAEAAKVIENTQRDINIALMNELSLIFHRLGINTKDVLEAAGTKWNFLKFTPGLVGGHCIGVDPYYLVHKAKEVGYEPHVIASGRKVNDYMPIFVAEQVAEGLKEAGKAIANAKVLVVGLTFKENVKDIRNSKITDTIAKLKLFGATVEAYDPLLTQEDVAHEHEFNGLTLVSELNTTYDAVIIAATHDAIKAMGNQFVSLMPEKPVLVDIKEFFPELKKDNTTIYKSL